MNNQLEKSLYEKEMLQKNVEMIKIGNNQLLEDNKNKEEISNRILNENKKLIEENNILSQKLKKMETLVYGKIKK